MQSVSVHDFQICSQSMSFRGVYEVSVSPRVSEMQSVSVHEFQRCSQYQSMSFRGVYAVSISP